MTSIFEPEPPAFVFERAHNNDHQFLFDFPNKKIMPNARQIQLQRLYDLVNLSVQRDDLPRARRAWSILARCKELNWKAMWRLGITILENDVCVVESNPHKIDFLRTMLLQLPEERERILAELVQHYILAGRYRDALDELEFYLPSFPYRDNPVLHVYAGLLCIFIAQHPESAWSVFEGSTYDNNSLSRAQTYLEHAKVLDPNNIVVSEFLHKVRCRDSVQPESSPLSAAFHFSRTRITLFRKPSF
ncbi:uncharacterized protein F5891DRAFT_939827 [Suillus fuscotomentosus]|uniref:Uncharacterized protein n=1 Tax=Suillus fuscotomentosus TaxID=1912939 RepID=A0AAD4EJ27_9AGAM|nr:uncharacterized protein F5891DRAFT_939827 [Suillus fuscotomentosus]KAG1906991.1 hypothetical protein F5891DRAFT_939827 [Suillus fuscotomentosus]